MLLFRSLRWRFQLFYGLLLFAVLVGFSVTGYGLQRAKMFREIDDGLRHRLASVSLRTAPPPPPGAPGSPEALRRGDRDGDRPGDRPGGRDFRGPRDGDNPERGRPRPDMERDRPRGDEGRPDGPPGPRRPGRPDEGRRPGPPDPADPPPPRRDPAAERRELLRQIQEGELFDLADRDIFYAAAWFRNGVNTAFTPGGPAGIPRPQRGDEPLRQRGTLREAWLFTSPGDSILVGRDIGPQLAELRRFEWLLTAAASGVFALVSLGGWWLAGRALRPVREISSAAIKIAAGDLGERIPTAETENELGQLAAVLNSTFARLEAAFAQQQRFTSDAAHELRTPLAVILSQVQTALTRERPAAEYREALEACQRAAQRMRRLIDSLLQLTRLDAGQEGLDATNFDLAETAGECLELVQPLATERGVSLVSDLRPTPAYGAPDRLAQVVTNLLTNAIQHTPPAGTVILACEPKTGAAVATVSDTGLGIPPDDLPHIFERFYRADRARSRPDGRTGLGLAISKAIVEAHGGSIEVESSGTGTAFTLRIPARLSDERESAAAPELLEADLPSARALPLRPQEDAGA